ncbi:unnamed protein product [Amoebophrya sp. A25]|nr:unnamed protein product [Amoebophrya sp. A25]|eukprot:GSA25T00010781001.1
MAPPLAACDTMLPTAKEQNESNSCPGAEKSCPGTMSSPPPREKPVGRWSSGDTTRLKKGRRKYSRSTLRDNNLLPSNERYHLSKTLPIPQRQKLIVDTYIQNFLFFLERENKCRHCCFLNEWCICENVRRLKSDTITNLNSLCRNAEDEEANEELWWNMPVTLMRTSRRQASNSSGLMQQDEVEGQPTTGSNKVVHEIKHERRLVRPRFLVWMHYKEQFRASNTGKILLQLFPGSQAFINGDPEETRRFKALLEEERSRKAILLFPTEDACDAEDLAWSDIFFGDDCSDVEDDHWGETSSDTEASTEDTKIRGNGERAEKDHQKIEFLNIVLLDGTWNQARKMLKTLFPRAKTKAKNVAANADKAKMNIARTLTHADASSADDETNQPGHAEEKVEQVVEQAVVEGIEQEQEDEQQASGAIDSTWSASPSLGDLLLPVKISPKELSRFGLRRQTQTDRICTLEAAIMLLQSVGGEQEEAEHEEKSGDGAAPAVKHDLHHDRNQSDPSGTGTHTVTETPVEQICSVLYDALALLCDAMERQSHKDTMPYVAPQKHHKNGNSRLPKNAHGRQIYA